VTRGIGLSLLLVALILLRPAEQGIVTFR